MNTLSAVLPCHGVPVSRWKPGIRRLFLVLRRTDHPTNQPIEGRLKQTRQRQLLKPPDILAGHPVWQGQVVHSGQNPTGVNPVGHAVHGKPHAEVAVPDRPQDWRRPAVLGQCRRVDIERPEFRYR